MEPVFCLANKKMLKVGGSWCLAIPGVWVKATMKDEKTKFSIELLDDQSIRIKPN